MDISETAGLGDLSRGLSLGLSEVRLHPAAACRAWIFGHGCVSAGEWVALLERTDGLRTAFEIARLRISEVLGAAGIDPLGITRKLLIHESSGAVGRGWLRESGFVHLEAASGIHLYALWRAYESGLKILVASFRWRPGITRTLRIFVPLAIWFMLFGLTGFRPGLLRPLALVGMRWLSTAYGFRWERPVPILMALTFDAGLALILAHGQGLTFAEWAPGELHYALSWWGGILGYEWARTRGYGTLASHASLSIASWIAILPLDWSEGRFSIWTPLFSLVTVEFLARGGFAVMVGLAMMVGWGSGGALPATGIASVAELLRWASVFWNFGIGELAAVASRFGAIRIIGPEVGVIISVWTGLALFLLAFSRVWRIPK